MILAQWFLWLITYSFFGWVYESILVSSREKHLVNRGFLTGPVLPVYGFGALISVFVMSGRSQNLLVLFISGMIFASGLEFFTSWLLEKLFKARWWDYSDEPYNLQGRIFLLGSVVFGAMSALLVKYIHPMVSGYISRMPEQLVLSLTFAIFTLMLIDLQNTVTHLVQLNSKLKEFQSAFNTFREESFKQFDDIKGEILELFEQSEMYQRRLSQRLEELAQRSIRMIRAYPKMKLLEYEEAWERLTREIRRRRNK